LYTFEAFAPGGASLGSISAILGGNTNQGQTDEDRFFGVSDSGGIGAIRVFSPQGHGFEVDHIQIGAAASVAAVPEPASLTVWISAMGLVAVRCWRRRRRITA
jgi:hypothetical protein